MKLPKPIRRLLSRLQPQAAHFISGLNSSADPGHISDGLDYGLPVVFHGYMSDWPSERQQAYLQEAARDTFRFQFDTPMRGANDMPFMVTEDPLREWDAGTREYVISTCHATYHRNPIAKRAVKYVSAFAVGQGFNLSCKNKDVERLLNEFIDNPDNAIRDYEQQAVIDLQVDGELLLRFYQGSGDSAGQVVMVPMRPWECRWIDTEAGFFRRPVSYRFQRLVSRGDEPAGGQHSEVEDVAADEILHVAINRHGYELRGRPELYDVLPWLRAYKEWLENRNRQNHWRGALLWWVKLVNARPETVAAKIAQYQRPPTPGSIAVTTDKEEWTPLTNPVGGSDAAEDGRQIKLMSAVGFGLPEYFLGDGENANLASSQSQQLPALTTFAQFQRIMIEVWTAVFRRVLQAQMDAGLLQDECPCQDADGDPLYEDPPKDDFGKPKTDEYGMPVKGAVKIMPTLKCFEVSYEPIGEEDKHTLAQALQIAIQQGWISNQTATEELGYDPDREVKRQDREEQQDANKVAAGIRPLPPMMRPDALANVPGQPPTNGPASDGANDGLPR